MLCFIIMLFVLLGVTFSWAEYIYLDSFPVEFLMSSMSWLAAFSMFIVFFIPALSVSLLGIVIMLKRRVGNAYFGWTLFGIWIMGLIGASFFVPSAIKNFRVENDHRKEIVFDKPSGTPTLNIGALARYEDYDGVTLKLRGHSDSTYKAVLRIESRGSSRQNARENAEAVIYNITQRGDDFIFDSEIDFNNAPFRFQQVDIIMYIPFGETFRMDQDLDEIIRNTLYLNGYRAYQMEGNDWVFDRDGINCLTCEPVSNRYNNSSRSYRRDSRSGNRGMDQSNNEQSLSLRNWDRVRGETITYDFEDFKAVRISALMNVKIVKGDTYSVEIKGEDVDEVYLNQRGNQLEIEYKNDWDWWDRKDWNAPEINIYITAPQLESIELIGGCRGEISGFDPRNFEINLIGASEVDADIDARYLDVNLTGMSKLNLNGSGYRLDAKIVGASRLYASGFTSERASVEVIGASKAQIHASEELKIHAAGVSTVYYSGTSNVDIESDGLSTVKRR
jgi:hypothetical protein